MSYRRLLPLCLGLIAGSALAQTSGTPDEAYLKARPEAMQRWHDRTFGLFMHWDPSSVIGTEISWSKENRVDVEGHGHVPDVIYTNLYRIFNPDEFDARAFVKTAQEAGMRYLVLTAKHHGGFCMFDSQLTDYKITRTMTRRDVLKELADACHAAGLSFGFYYSQPDWYHPDFVRKDFDAYRPYLFGQLRELCSNYGKVDQIFFDGLFYGEKEYHSKELFKMIRELQPDVVINNRCGLKADHDTPEQMVGAFQNDRPWESCMTLGTSWSWKVNDKLKSSDDCIRILVQTVGGGGNLLLNVGPMPNGMIEPRQTAILKGIGDWLGKHGESIYGLRGGPYKPAGWGACTSKGNTVYLHVLSWFDAPEFFPPLGAKITKAELLTGGKVKVIESKKGLQFRVAEKDRHPVDTIIKLTVDTDTAKLEPVLVPTKSIARFAKMTASCNPATAAALVDDDPKTEWASDAKQCWFEVDLGAMREFNRVDIREEGHEWDVRTKDFDLEYRRETGDWIKLDHGTHIGHTYTRSFKTVSGRYVRLKVNDSGKLPHFSEFQVYN